MGKSRTPGASGFPARPVYSFGPGSAEGSEELRHLLGGKGAGLAEMSRLNIPVPPGFTITTEVCNYYYAEHAGYPGPLAGAVDDAIATLEQHMGQGFGDPARPLLVSVRSGSSVSMPGMMDTVLNLGLNPDTLSGLEKRSGCRRFALDCYRRLIEMYGDVVRGVDHRQFSAILEGARRSAGVDRDHELSAERLDEVVEGYLAVYEKAAGSPFPADPREQLRGSIDAVFESWMVPRAVTYRRIHGIPHDLGTAVNVQAMVFGNLGPSSATGVCFTRDPASGEPSFFGEFLPNAQGEDVVAGIRTPQPMRSDEGPDSFEALFPDCYRELVEVRRRLEEHFADMQDVEFTVEENRLYILQTRRGQRTGPAALRIACDMVDEGLVDEHQGLRVVEPEGLVQVLAPAFAAEDLARAEPDRMLIGLAASPGAAAGRIALTADEAVALRSAGTEAVILVRRETSPEDIHGMDAAAGIVTTRGGKTSHAAVVARGMGKPCIVGCEDLKIDDDARQISAGGFTLPTTEAVSVDGSTGALYRGALPVRDPEVLQVLAGRISADESTVFAQFQRVLKWADEVRRLRVRANADTPEDARLARHLGAEGIGLCRTEHMFFAPERLVAFRRMILAASDEERSGALDEILPYQRKDFLGIFRAMDGLPVTIRLLDPPLHEFLPHAPEEVARLAKELGVDPVELEKRVEGHRESNPMLGLRGCRLGLAHPEIYAMQMRAIIEAALDARAEGVTARPEIMIPLTAIQTETERMRSLFEATLDSVCDRRGAQRDDVTFLFGTMIEIPRAALTADRIAAGLDFFSFGTNDLTQMCMGLSRDDTAALLVDYVEKGLLPHDPFTSLDIEGVGSLIEIAVARGREGNPNLKIGICGEHGGDPRSVEFCHGHGFDYVSCTAYRLPVARLAAAQANL